jgi:hypothetical protein
MAVGQAASALKPGDAGKPFALYGETNSVEHHTLCQLFLHMVEGAKGRRRTLLKLQIRRAAQGTDKKPGDWRAAQALGAITDPEEFVPQVRIHISTQLDEALDRLREVFPDDQDYERALHAVAGGTRGAAPGGDTPGEGGRYAEGGEAVLSEPALPKAADVP